jgi:hypothetical protein
MKEIFQIERDFSYGINTRAGACEKNKSKKFLLLIPFLLLKFRFSIHRKISLVSLFKLIQTKNPEK